MQKFKLSPLEIQKVEELNESFRDALVQEREYMGNARTIVDPAQAKEVQAIIKKCVEEARVILDQNDVKSREELKIMSKKYFMMEFLNELFKDGVYDSEACNMEIDIDCGL